MGDTTKVTAIQNAIPRFSWAAFLFPVLWPLVYGLPGMAAIAFAIPVLAQVLGGWFLPGPVWVPTLTSSVVSIGVYVYVGFRANEAYWRKSPERIAPEAFIANQRKWIAVGLVLAVGMVLYVFVGYMNARTSGDGTATYRAIATPDVISSADRASVSLATSSLGGWVTPVRITSKTMISDAGGAPVPGGEENRETQGTATVFIPRWPFVASMETWGWGQPDGRYRLDFQMWSAPVFLDVMNTTVTRGLSVSDVEAEPERVEELITEVLRTSGLGDVYAAGELAGDARIVQNWCGDGIVTVAVILPVTSRVPVEGSLTVDIGRDWQIESFNLWTDETFAYEDAVNPQPESAIPESLLLPPAP